MVNHLVLAVLVVFILSSARGLYVNNSSGLDSDFNNDSLYRNFSSGDMYLDEAYDTCLQYRTSLKCAKYKALKYLYDITSPYQGHNDAIVLGNAVKLVTIPRKPSEPSSPLFPDSQPRSTDSELDKVFGFALRRMERFIMARAVSVDLPVATPGARGLDEDAPRLVDENQQLEEEGRGKKKKLALLLPLALAFKIKALLVPTLLGVLFIKKLLVLGAVLLPGLLSYVKYCRPPPHHHTHAVHTGYSADFDSASEFSSGPGFAAPPHYKDYPSRRHNNVAYRAYNGY
ncbi:uncharacterized protein [Anabrus simplex]|uniref:uncharacterized protein n=1 Tax=Anabrus simplex TaxID=316456 RepID=UPI0035A37A22